MPLFFAPFACALGLGLTTPAETSAPAAMRPLPGRVAAHAPARPLSILAVPRHGAKSVRERSAPQVLGSRPAAEAPRAGWLDAPGAPGDRLPCPEPAAGTPRGPPPRGSES